MGHAQESAHSILGRNNAFALGWPDADQLRRTFRRRHRVALASRVADGKGALLTGDIITVVQDRRYVSFMRSYPNLIPLGAAAIHRILERIEPFSFEQIYGGWWKANVLADAKAAVVRSARTLSALRSARETRMSNDQGWRGDAHRTPKASRNTSSASAVHFARSAGVRCVLHRLQSAGAP